MLDCFGRWQIDQEAAAPIGLTDNADGPFTLTDHSIHCGQPHASSTGTAFGGEEWLKNMLLRLFIHAHAAVGNANAAVRPRLQIRIQIGIAVGNGIEIGGNGQLSTVGHGIAGIDHNVDDGLFNLTLIGVNDGMGLRQIEFHGNAIPKNSAKQHLHIFQHSIQIEIFRLQNLMPTNCQ